MRVLLSVHHLLNPNAGAAGVTIRVSDGLRAIGHSTSLLSMSDMGLQSESIYNHLQYPWFVYRQLKQRHDEFDVLDLSSGDGWIFERRYPRVKQLLVARSHGLEHTVDESIRESAMRGELALSWKYPLYHGGYRLWEVAESFRRADVSLFLNRSDMDYAVKTLRVPANRARVVDNGIGDQYIGLPFTPSRPAGLRIAFIGTYSQRKIANLPALINELFAIHPAWQIGFFGSGLDDKEVRKDFSDEIQDRISLVRKYDNQRLPELLKGYDVLLFPSLFEGFPLSVLEAMACGLALVASALPALSERLRNGEEALLVPPGDNSGLRAALESLAEDPSKLLRLQEAGHRRVQHFSWKRIASDTAEIYSEALEAKRATQT